MSAKTMGQVWDLDIPHNQLIVLLAMTDHADHNGGGMYPSMGLIAHKTGYSERQVKRIIKGLVQEGLLVLEKIGNGTVNTYRANFSNAKKKEPYKTRDKMSPLEKPTHDTAMSQGVGHPDVTPTHDIQMSPKPSLEPSLNHIDDSKVISMPQAVMEESVNQTTASHGKVVEKKPAEYLADAMGIKLVSGSADWSLYTKRANELIKAGIPVAEFGTYVARIRREAVGKWKVTVNSLTSNGRMSEYVTARDKHAESQAAAQQSTQTDATELSDAYLLNQLRGA